MASPFRRPISSIRSPGRTRRFSSIEMASHLAVVASLYGYAIYRGETRLPLGNPPFSIRHIIDVYNARVNVEDYENYDWNIIGSNLIVIYNPHPESDESDLDSISVSDDETVG
jgi:hypothetical protein